MNNKIWLKRIIGSVFGLFVFAAVMLVLTHTAQNSVATTQILPTINPDPVYVECPAGEEREITWKVKEDFSVSGFDLLLVNVSSESQGIFRMKIWNSEKELIFNDSLAVNEMSRVSGRFFLRSFRFRKERSTGLSSRRMQVIPISCRCRMAGEKSFLLKKRYGRMERLFPVESLSE